MENYSAIKRNNMREVKDARIKRLHPVGLRAYDSLEKATLQGRKADLWLLGAGSGEVWATGA